MSERRERRYTLHLASGVIFDADGGGIIPRNISRTVEEIPDEEWRTIGAIDQTGHARIDYGLARRWRSLAEPWRW